MKTENSKCLVLNGDYSPLGIIDWKKAITWCIKYEHKDNSGVEILDFYKNDFIVGINDKKHPIPAVVKTNRYFRINNQRVNFSRKNLFIRDQHTCQYCGVQKDFNKLTYDHVIPKSFWKNKGTSTTSWTNIVTACVECNRKKGSRTPKQANMPLLNLPIVPQKNIRYLPISHHLSIIRSDIPEEWRLYLPPSYTMDSQNESKHQ
jgi:5-methylcytosine-specific restriction endonuclease McrA